MKKLLFIIVFAFGLSNAFAQTDTIKSNKPIPFRCYATNVGQIEPLIIINSKIAPKAYLEGFNPSEIDSLRVLKDASATALYGSRGANGVILVWMKKNIQWASLQALFNEYHINQADQKLPIFFKDIEVETDLILIDPKRKLVFEVQTGASKKLRNLSIVDKYLNITDREY